MARKAAKIVLCAVTFLLYGNDPHFGFGVVEFLNAWCKTKKNS